MAPWEARVGVLVDYLWAPVSYPCSAKFVKNILECLNKANETVSDCRGEAFCSYPGPGAIIEITTFLLAAIKLKNPETHFELLEYPLDGFADWTESLQL